MGLLVVCSAMADSWTWNATSGALGTARTYNATLNGKAWTVTRSSVVYTGWSSPCIQFGSKSGAESVLLSSSAFTDNITSVAVECASYNGAHKCTIEVGGTEYVTEQNTSSWATVETITTGTINATGTINILFENGNRALYIKSITVTTQSVTLESLAVSGTPTKTTYEAGEALDPAGLVVTGTYSDGSSAAVTSGVEWTLDPEAFSAGQTSCDVMASVGNVVSDVYTVSGLTVRYLTSIAVSGTPTKTSYIRGEALDPAGLNVTGTYNDGGTIALTSGISWVLDPETFSAGQTTCDVMAGYGTLLSDVYTVSGLTVEARYNVELTYGENSWQGTCSVNPSTNITAGTTVTLTATPNAGYRLKEWTVLDEEGNDIPLTGNTFTMPAGDVTAEATFEVIHVESIALDVTTLTLRPYDTHTLVVTLTPTSALNQEVIFVSGDETICEVNNNGVIKGLAEGETTVTAITDDGELEAVCNVTVRKEAVTLHAQNLTLRVGESGTVEYTVEPYVTEVDNAITAEIISGADYVSFSPMIARGVAVGEAQCRVYFPGSKHYSAAADTVTITVVRSISGIRITGTPATTAYTAGQAFSTEGLSAEYIYTDGTYEAVDGTITWTVNPAVLRTSTTEVTVTAKVDTYTSAEATYSVTVTPDPAVASALFYESFDETEGSNCTGGNDGLWSGSIATGTLKFDNEGWTCNKQGGAYHCAKLGSGSAAGSATTPEIEINGNAVLTFKAGAWAGDAITLNISATGCTLSESSVTLVSGEWTEYTIAITDATTAKITFAAAQASKNRFFLDEVMVVEAPQTTTTGDVNGDGNVDVSDISVLAEYIFGGTPTSFDEDAADANGDGQIDVSDISTIAEIIFAQ